MKCIDFPERNIIIAEHQPEYMPIPAFYSNGAANFCWELSDDEIAKLIITRKLWHTVYVGGAEKLQLQLLQVNKPEMN